MSAASVWCHRLLSGKYVLDCQMVPFSALCAVGVFDGGGSVVVVYCTGGGIRRPPRMEWSSSSLSRFIALSGQFPDLMLDETCGLSIVHSLTLVVRSLFIFAKPLYLNRSVHRLLVVIYTDHQFQSPALSKRDKGGSSDNERLSCASSHAVPLVCSVPNSHRPTEQLREREPQQDPSITVSSQVVRLTRYMQTEPDRSRFPRVIFRHS